MGARHSFVVLSPLLVETRESRDDQRDPSNNLKRLNRNPNSTQRCPDSVFRESEGRPSNRRNTFGGLIECA